jgi:hypothetical protein
MGKIINLPLNINRHYQLSDAESAALLLQDLEKSAKLVEKNPGKATVEDLADIRAARRARKGELIPWEDAKAYLDTLPR